MSERTDITFAEKNLPCSSSNVSGSSFSPNCNYEYYENLSIIASTTILKYNSVPEMSPKLIKTTSNYNIP